MGKTLDVARDRAFDQTKTVLPAEVARGTYMQNPPGLAALKLMHLLIAKAGGKNVGSVLSGSWAQISVEDLLIQNPDIIILGDSAYGMTPDQVVARAGWENIKAVTNGQIYAFNDDLVTLAGPRLVDGLEELAKLIHPELFK